MNQLAKSMNLSGLRLYALFTLRIVIAWHFLYEGVTKLMMMPGWTSADFKMLEDVNIANEILAGNLNRVRPWKG